ncbi:MAG: PAS domain S-box protein [Chloroflexia bacterium]
MPGRYWPGLHSAGGVVRGVIITTVTLLFVEVVLASVLGIPTPILVLAAVAYAGFIGGVSGGLLSAAETSIYALWFYRAPAGPALYTEPDALRALMFILTAFAIGFMTGRLRQATLLASERTLRQLQFSNAITGSLGEGVLAVDPDGRLTFMNAAAERMLGSTVGRLRGREVRETVLRGSTLENSNLDLTEVLGSGATRRVEGGSFAREDGGRLTVSATASPILSDGAVIGAVVVFSDIADRQAAESAVRRSEERYRSLVLATSQIAWTTDAQGAVVDDFVEWRDYTGQSRAEVQGWVGSTRCTQTIRTGRRVCGAKPADSNTV